jgi:nucleoid-associated protein YgaU
VDSLGTDFDGLLVHGAVAALAVSALWIAVVVVAVAVEARTGGLVRFAERAGCPRLLRWWLLALFVALFAGVAPAEAAGHGPQPREPVATDATLEGLRLPDRDSGTGRSVTVRHGDTLWSIATELLRDPGHATRPDGPTPADIARTVIDLHAANRHVIGEDPDLIRPGQHLRIPEEA